MPIAPDIRVETPVRPSWTSWRGGPVARQSEFVERLLQADGIEATQSSVSRDLRELGIAKLGAGLRATAGRQRRPVSGQPTVPSLALCADVQTAGNSLTVVRAPQPGPPSASHVFLDRSAWPEIVGTVSGDDTIFVATRNVRATKRDCVSRLRTTLQ